MADKASQYDQKDLTLLHTFIHCKPCGFYGTLALQENHLKTQVHDSDATLNDWTPLPILVILTCSVCYLLFRSPDPPVVEVHPLYTAEGSHTIRRTHGPSLQQEIKSLLTQPHVLPHCALYISVFKVVRICLLVVAYATPMDTATLNKTEPCLVRGSNP